jgi:predicted permease
MSLHSEDFWQGCPTNRGQSTKTSRRIPSHFPSLLVILYGLLKMTSGTTVPDPDPELINAQNFDFAKPKLFFKNIGKYTATSTYIHVRIPFNFTTVLSTQRKP